MWVCVRGVCIEVLWVDFAHMRPESLLRELFPIKKEKALSLQPQTIKNWKKEAKKKYRDFVIIIL